MAFVTCDWSIGLNYGWALRLLWAVIGLVPQEGSDGVACDGSWMCLDVCMREREREREREERVSDEVRVKE